MPAVYPGLWSSDLRYSFLDRFPRRVAGLHWTFREALAMRRIYSSISTSGYRRHWWYGIPGRPVYGIRRNVRGTYPSVPLTLSWWSSVHFTSPSRWSIYGDVIINALHIPLETFPKHLRLSIPNKTKVGDVFTLRGRVPSAAERFVVNLQCGPGQSDDVVFHFNPRMDDGHVIRNSRLDEQWSEEEKGGGMPFKAGEHFRLMIGTAKDSFMTWVNGQEFAKFTHRLDMTNACILFVEGEADFEDICIDSVASRLPPQSEDNKTRSFQNSEVVLFNPAVPLVHRIPNGMSPGKIITISGTINKDAKRLSVNLQCDADDEAAIAYHYNPRFEDGVVVQNSKDDGNWNEEVRSTQDFPFLAGAPFDLQIVCTPSGGYFAAVNGAANAVFPSRLECGRADHLMIEGDLSVQRILVL